MYIYIKPEYRNQKIATNLIKYLKNIAIKNSYSKIELVVIKENSSAITFYKKIKQLKQIDYIDILRIDLDQ